MPRTILSAHFSSTVAVLMIAAVLFCASVLAGPKKTLPPHPIDLNRATIEQLEELPGVGPARAQAILKFRQESGPFERVDDLLAVRGMSRRRLEKIIPYVFVRKKDQHPPSTHPHAKSAVHPAPAGP